MGEFFSRCVGVGMYFHKNYFKLYPFLMIRSVIEVMPKIFSGRFMQMLGVCFHVGYWLLVIRRAIAKAVTGYWLLVFTF